MDANSFPHHLPPLLALNQRNFISKLVEIMMMTMDNSATPNWVSELGMEDPFLNDQCDIMDYLNEDLCDSLGESFDFSSDLNSFMDPNPTLFPFSDYMDSPLIDSVFERPSKLLKTNSQNPSTIPNFDQTISTPFVLTFGNPNSPEINNNNNNQQTLINPDEDSISSEVLNSQLGSYENLEEAAKPTKKSGGGRVRPTSQTYDHIIAERKRRQILSQRFMDLSTLVPGLKKMDKTSVLGDAINYLKCLQERVKTLEEKSAKQTMESVVMVKKSQVIVEDEDSSDDLSEELTLPEIEAKVSNKTILLRIHCEKHKGVLVKLLSEVDKFNLDVTNINVVSFGSLALHITIIAQMEKEFNVTAIQLIKTLRSILQNTTPPQLED